MVANFPLVGLGWNPFPDGKRRPLAEWRKLVPEPYDEINGRKPPGIPMAVNSTVNSWYSIRNVSFINWWIPGRPPGSRTLIHFHPRPQMVCLVSGHIRTMIDGFPDQDHGPGDCFLMPQNRKMVNLALGPEPTYTDFDTFRVPIEKPLWVVVEPDQLHLQDKQFDVKTVNRLSDHTFNQTCAADEPTGELSLSTPVLVGAMIASFAGGLFVAGLIVWCVIRPRFRTVLQQ